MIALQEDMMEHSNFSLELSGIMYWIEGDSAIWEIVNSFAGENPHDSNHLNVVQVTGVKKPQRRQQD